MFCAFYLLFFAAFFFTFVCARVCGWQNIKLISRARINKSPPPIHRGTDRLPSCHYLVLVAAIAAIFAISILNIASTQENAT